MIKENRYKTKQQKEIFIAPKNAMKGYRRWLQGIRKLKRFNAIHII